MPKFYLSPAALDDLENIWAFIALDNPEAASRVINAAYRTFGILSRHPEIGRIRPIKKGEKQVRSFLVSDFRNYVVYYQLVPDGINVLHVVHGARDQSRFFVDESGNP